MLKKAKKKFLKSTKNLEKNIQKKAKQVLKNLDLSIEAGKTVALVGPSGSGKSTLANLISRFYDIDSGKILIGNVNVKDIEKKELMNTISFVFQNSKLLKTSIYENVKNV